MAADQTANIDLMSKVLATQALDASVPVEYKLVSACINPDRYVEFTSDAEFSYSHALAGPYVTVPLGSTFGARVTRAPVSYFFKGTGTLTPVVAG